MRTASVPFLDATGRTAQVQYPNSIAFMYSRQPLIVALPADDSEDIKSVTVIVSAQEGASHRETRTPHEGRVEFDLRRMFQLLSKDIDTVLRRLDRADGLATNIVNDFNITIRLDLTDGTVHDLATYSVTCLYGALDQGEIYGEHTQRRLWLNYPQTFALWKDPDGEMMFVTDDAYVYPDADGSDCAECDFVQTLKSAGETELLNELRNGKPLLNLGLSWRTRIEGGRESVENLRTVTLVPDNTRRGEGTYLRWINRRGELSYFLFTNSTLRVTSSVSETFSRYYPGDPATYESGSFVNPQKANYREAREMVLGAVGLSLDEFEDLCDLATSPVVERLVPDLGDDAPTNRVYDGGDAAGGSTIFLESETTNTEVGDGDATSGVVPIVNRWQRVNVAAGTFERNIRRSTPSRQDLEILIELPERNTVQL